MAALPDWLKKNMPKATLGSAFGAAMFAPDVAGVVTAENKLTAIGKALANIYFWVGKIFAPVRQALYGGWMILGFNAVSKAVHALIKDTGSLEAALRRLQSVRGFERQFTALTGGLDAAKQRVAELLVLSARGPFKFEELASASRNLEIFTRGALSGTRATQMIGNVAIASGNGIEETAGAVGNFYSTLRDGQPIGSATEQLRQMGVISQKTANDLNNMSAHGATASEVFNALSASLEQSQEALKGTSDDLSILTAEHQKAVTELQTKFGAPWTQEEVNSMKNGTKAIQAITPALEAVSKQLAVVFSGFQTGKSLLLRFAAESQVTQTAIRILGSALATLSVIAIAFGTVMLSHVLPALQALGTTAAAGVATALARIGVSAGLAAQSALILNTAFRGLATLLVAGGVTAGLLAVAGILINVGMQIKASWDKMQQLSAGFKQSNDAIQEQIRLISTLAERHETLAKAIDQSIAAEEEYHRLLRSVQSGNVGDVLSLIAARKAAQEAKKTVAQAAAVGPEGLGSPERKAFIQQREQERLAREEREFQATQAAASPEGRIISARQRADTLGARAERGFRAAEQRKNLAEAESDIDRRRQQAENRKRIAEEEVKADKEQMALVRSRSAFPFAVPGQSVTGRRAQSRVDAAKKEIENLDQEARRVRGSAQFRETAEGKGALAEQFRQELDQNKNITSERKKHVLAMIEMLDRQRQQLENERESASQLKTQSDELRQQAALEERALNIQRIRSSAELEATRATGSPGERARKEFEIGTRSRQAELIELQQQQAIQVDIANKKIEAEKVKPGGGDKDLISQLTASRDALSAQNEERIKGLRIQQAQADTGERERIRGQVVTRFQTELETRGTQARLAGQGEQAKTAEHLRNFVSKFEQLRQQFGDQEAKRIALQQEQNEIAKEGAAIAGHLKPVADSLTRIGGGGGVGGPTGDPKLIIQQRQLELQKLANQYLQAIEQELRKEGAPPEGGGGGPTQGGGGEVGRGGLPPGASFTPQGMQTAEGNIVPSWNLPPDLYQAWQQDQQGQQNTKAPPAPGAPLLNPAPEDSLKNTMAIPVGASIPIGVKDAVARPIDTSGAGGERYFTPGADISRTLKDIRRDSQISNDHLSNISNNSNSAGKSL